MVEATLAAARLAVSGLSCSNGQEQVLDNFALQVAPGETVAIIGRSGSGKSTLLRCLSMLQKPHAGSAALDGVEYQKDGQVLIPEWQIRKQIVMVFQNYNLFANMTAMRNITLALEKVAGVSKTDATDRAQEVARALGIEQVLDRYPDALSGGQAQRLALARAMVLQPKV